MFSYLKKEQAEILSVLGVVLILCITASELQ